MAFGLLGVSFAPRERLPVAFFTQMFMGLHLLGLALGGNRLAEAGAMLGGVMMGRVLIMMGANGIDEKRRWLGVPPKLLLVGAAMAGASIAYYATSNILAAADTLGAKAIALMPLGTIVLTTTSDAITHSLGKSRAFMGASGVWQGIYQWIGANSTPGVMACTLGVSKLAWDSARERRAALALKAS